jgi:lysophospholipase L1-like esterase
MEEVRSLTSVSGASPPAARARSPLRRIGVHVGVILYSIAIFLALDFVYSTWINSEASPHIAVRQFDHGLLPNFDGYARFGEFRYRFITDSLGFRDAATRQVPLKSDRRRILIIGDSVTEGMVVSFEESFAGLLERAGQDAPVRTEFLNAAVTSYSPAIYYAKIKYLLDSGLKFDEVVVLPDISDVQDEATSYFCIDEDPQYRRRCRNPNPDALDAAHPDFAPTTGTTRSDLWLERHFVVTDLVRMLIKTEVQWLRDGRRANSVAWNPRAGWTIPGYRIDDTYEPLGIDGGIARAKQNMQKLADLLRARNIPLTVAVYPWPLQLALDDRDSRQAHIWRDFCAGNCKDFIDLFPAFFAEKDLHDDWYRRLFITGDLHPSAAGNRLIFEHLARHLLPGRDKPGG